MDFNFRTFAKRLKNPPIADLEPETLTGKNPLNFDKKQYGPPRINEQSRPFLNVTQLKDYERDGVICLRNILTPSEIEALRADVDAQIDLDNPNYTAVDFERVRRSIWSEPSYELHDGQSPFEYEPHDARATRNVEPLGIFEMLLKTDPTSERNVDKTYGAVPGQFLLDHRRWPYFPNIKDIACFSALPPICADLLRSERLSFWGDILRVKTPNTSQRTSLHQDWAFVSLTGTQSCSVWIPLDPVTKTNGGPYFVKGSHKWGKTYASNLLIASTPNPLSLYEPVPDIEHTLQEHEILHFDMEPGDILIHDIMTLLGSGGNTSLFDMRRAISLRYCGDDIRFFDKPGAFDLPDLNPKPENGTPLCPEFFPPVWPTIH